jgi:DNA-directed RNA polymerase
MDFGLLSTEFEIEKQARGDGIIRTHSRNKKLRESGLNSMTRSSKHLVGSYIDVIAEAIRSDLQAWHDGKARSNFEAFQKMVLLEVDVLAVITLKTVMDFCSTVVDRKLRDSATSLFKEVGEKIETELRIRTYEEAAPELFGKIEEDLKRRAWGYKYKRRKLMEAAKRAGIEWQAWSTSDKLKLGIRLVDYVLTHTNIIEITHVNRDQKRVRFTDECVAWITKADHLQAMHEPYWSPMVVKPRPWEDVVPDADPKLNKAGGYISPHLPPLSLVRTANRDYLEELRAFEMPDVFRSINAIQDTRWRVDQEMLDLITELWSRESPLGGLPAARNIDIPPKPTTKVDQAEWKQWKGEAVKAYAAKAKSVSKRILVSRTLSVADKFKNFDELFYVHTLDFRGRSYPMATYLQPQGDGVSRSLLRFADAEGKAMTDEGARELALYGASLYGHDKCSLDDRIKWVADNEEPILASADDPYQNNFWCDPDKPFLFLAWCKEWKGWKDHGKNFYSTLPVMRDGTCNAIQHWAAILRDAEAAKHVNMEPHEIPGDAYNVALTHLTDMLKKKAKLGDRYAQGWLDFGLDRKLTKTPTMTLAYGSTKFRCTENICDWVADKVEAQGIPEPFDGDYFGAAQALTNDIWASIKQTVGSVMIGMDYLQNIARVLHKAGMPVTWVTPTGFYVRQMYPELKDRRIKTKLLGNQIRVLIKEGDPQKLALHKQVNSVSANFIHSLDASAMMSTVCAAQDRGVTAFCMIHDSFGTVAADSPILTEETRKCFVNQYTDTDFLADMRDQTKKIIPKNLLDDLPEVPSMGTFEVDQVLKSDHFFS